MLELVEDADLFRGRSAVGCCALGARSSWLVGIRFEGKSGHLERVEMTEIVREVLPLAAGCTTGLQKRWQRRGNQWVHVGFSHCPRRTGIRLTARRAMPCHAILSHLLTPPP